MFVREVSCERGVVTERKTTTVVCGTNIASRCYIEEDSSICSDLYFYHHMEVSP
jgi:hypothetical protein